MLSARLTGHMSRVGYCNEHAYTMYCNDNGKRGFLFSIPRCIDISASHIVSGGFDHVYCVYSLDSMRDGNNTAKKKSPKRRINDISPVRVVAVNEERTSRGVRFANVYLISSDDLCYYLQ